MVATPPLPVAENALDSNWENPDSAENRKIVRSSRIRLIFVLGQTIRLVYSCKLTNILANNEKVYHVSSFGKNNNSYFDSTEDINNTLSTIFIILAFILYACIHFLIKSKLI